MLEIDAWNPIENDVYREICEWLLNNSGAKTYPYPVDIQSDRELMEIAEGQKNKAV